MNKLICCPILWTTITIDLDEEDLLAKVAIFLQFSQRSKISLQFLAPIRTTPPEVYSILTPHRERIAGLWFHIPTVNRVRKALQVIQRLGDLPSLEWIGSAGSGFTKEDVRQILRYAPCLRRISNLHMRPEDLNSSLTVLPYRITLDTRRDEPVSAWLNFSHLQHLNLGGGCPNYHEVLNQLNSPLATLRLLDVNQRDFGPLVGSVSRFPGLESLTIDIIFRSKTHQLDHYSTIPTPVLPIKSLHLQFPTRSREKELDASIMLQTEIINIVESSMPQIECLTILKTSITISLLSLFRSLRRLRQLTIWALDSAITVTESFSLHLLKLEYLKWNITLANLFRSRPLVTPYLAACSFWDGYYNMYDPAVTYATSLLQWCSTSLVQLSIDTGEPFHFSLQNLPTLRELSFGKSMHNCWIGDILEQWILQPRACPALRKLTFKGRCKEWDLLFLVLERQNFLKDPTISPIQEIEIMPT
ncbi:hypothetical protein FRB91_000672 [Serendipita sp. 411]|nr:hypothetical protein FRB91_000672 [Serendipita sp. 411]